MTTPTNSPRSHQKQMTWILVADGARARILKRVGAKNRIDPVPGGRIVGEAAPNRDLVSDRSGRVSDRNGTGSHAVQSSVDWHRLEKERFVGRIAQRIDDAARSGAFDRLVLVAPPQSLGDLRSALDQVTRQRVVAEIGKDLTHMADEEIGRQLAQAGVR